MSTIERNDLGYGIEQHTDKGIIFITNAEGNMSREAVDCWAQAVSDACYQLNDAGIVLILNDASHRSIGVTPYARERMTSVSRNFDGEGQVYMAQLVSDSIVSRALAILFRGKVGKNRNVTIRMFTRREKALDWLHTHVK